jgi:hypothetical protein
MREARRALSRGRRGRGGAVLVGALALLGLTSVGGCGTQQPVAASRRFPAMVAAWEPVANTGPSPRESHAMAYEPESGTVLLYGGWDGATAFDDTWRWDGSTATWTYLSPTNGPGRRTHHGMAYCPGLGIVLFGGKYNNAPAPTSNWTYKNDLWKWDGEDWSPITAGGTLPGPRASFGMACDGGRLVVACGDVGSGSSEVPTRETWVFDGAAWSPGGIGPSARVFVAMSGDGAGGAVLFGGLGSGALNDTWHWDGAAWHELAIIQSPSPRGHLGMALDSARARFVIHSGWKANAGVEGTFELNETTWTLTATDGPSPRYGHAMAYDQRRGRVLLFGGGIAEAKIDGNHFNDTWEYHTRGGACELGEQCNTGFCVDRVCCESEGCSACERCDLESSPGTCAPAPDGVECEGGTCRSGVCELLDAGEPPDAGAEDAPPQADAPEPEPERRGVPGWSCGLAGRGSAGVGWLVLALVLLARGLRRCRRDSTRGSEDCP